MRVCLLVALLALPACDDGGPKKSSPDAAPALDAAIDAPSSPIPPGTPLVDLTPAQLMTFCTASSAAIGPERTIDCGGGVTITVGGDSVSECVMEGTEFQQLNPNCETTYGEATACFDALGMQTDAQWCGDTQPAACEPLFNPSANCMN